MRTRVKGGDRTLKVNVLLFASYKERSGTSELSIGLTNGDTVGDFANEIVRTFPNLISDPNDLVIAVNWEYRDHSYCLEEGDEVALIPPVSGGG